MIPKCRKSLFVYCIEHTSVGSRTIGVGLIVDSSLLVSLVGPKLRISYGNILMNLIANLASPLDF